MGWEREGCYVSAHNLQRGFTRAGQGELWGRMSVPCCPGEPQTQTGREFVPVNVVPTCASVSSDSLRLCLLLSWVQFNIQMLLMQSPVLLLISSTPQWPFGGEATIFSGDKSVAFCCGFLFFNQGKKKLTVTARLSWQPSHLNHLIRPSLWRALCTSLCVCCFFFSLSFHGSKEFTYRGISRALQI